MIGKVVLFFGFALLALSEARSPVSEQKVQVETHEKLSHVGSHKPEHHEVYAWSYPSYEFKYEVADPHTHDFKGQEESRKGDEVKGHYWLIQPDGYKRTVKYYADKHSGFKADVDYTKVYHKTSEDKEENEGGEEENSNSTEDGNSENENNENDNNANGNDESSSNNENESANLEDASENENQSDRGTWNRGNIKFWGRKRERNEQNNNEESEQEAGSSENVNSEEEQAGENEDNGNEEEQSNGSDNGNEGSSAMENKSEKHVVKHEYHVIIHHPKYVPSYKKHGN